MPPATGCRYALANNTSSTIASDTTTMVTGGTLANGTVVPNRMAGQNTAAFTSFTVTVSGVHNGVTYTGNGVNTLVAGDMITVTVTGTYNFMNIIPFLHMGTMTMTSTDHGLRRRELGAPSEYDNTFEQTRSDVGDRTW